MISRKSGTLFGLEGANTKTSYIFKGLDVMLTGFVAIKTGRAELEA